MRVDVHSHVIPRRMIDAIRQAPGGFAAKIETLPGGERVVHDQGYVYPLFSEFFDPDAKIASMDRRGIDISIVSAAPPMFYYWADPKLALKSSRLVNDGIAEIVAAHPA